MIFIIAMIVFIIIEIINEPKFDSNRNSNIMLAHNSFCLISSSILFIFGFRIKRMISKSLKDSLITQDYSTLNSLQNEIDSEKKINTNTYNDNNEQITTNEDYKDLMVQSIGMTMPNSNGEIYFNVRIAQVNIVTFSFMLCDAYELVFCFGVKLLSGEHFKMNGYRIVPLTEEGSIFYFIDMLCIILPIFTNFIAFYYIIRKSYEFSESRRMSSCNFLDKDISRYATKSTKDIEQYLK
jgi:hypothetical protein